MPTSVHIEIVGRTYEVTCDEGQEAYLQSLGGDVNRRAKDMLRAVGQVGDARLMVMVALAMADEIAELRRGGRLVDNGPDAVDAVLAQDLDRLVERIESIAARFEKA